MQSTIALNVAKARVGSMVHVHVQFADVPLFRCPGHQLGFAIQQHVLFNYCNIVKLRPNFFAVLLI